MNERSAGNQPALFFKKPAGKFPAGFDAFNAIKLFLLPVVPDVLDIVVILQHVDELGHVFNVALVRQGDVVLWNHLDLSAGELILATF